MPVTQDRWINKVLGGTRYVISEKLGEGGMGAVYLAEDRQLGTWVVIKTPHSSMVRDPEFSARFKLEVQSLIALSHPRIVRVLDVGQYGEFPFVVLQYLSGSSLDSRLYPATDSIARPQLLTQVCAWLTEIAAALDFIHLQGYIHRDIKPANILFDENQHAYLTDFGIAKVLATVEGSPESKLTATGMILGTAEYMAPELLQGKPVDRRVDQYALAVTVFEALSGTRPYDGSTPAALAFAQVQQPIPQVHQRVPGLPEEVSNVLSRALALSPNERFRSCEEFAAALRAAGLTIDSTRRSGHAEQSVSVTSHNFAAGEHLAESQRSQTTTSSSLPKTDVVLLDPLAVLGISDSDRASNPFSEPANSSRLETPEPWLRTPPPHQRGSDNNRTRPWMMIGAAALFVLLASVAWVMMRTTPESLTTDNPTSEQPPNSNAKKVSTGRTKSKAVSKSKNSPQGTDQKSPSETAPPPAKSMEDSVGMQFVLIEPGEFLMGSPDSDTQAGANEKPQHRVRITRPFYLAKFEVTQAEYEQVMGTNPSHFASTRFGSELFDQDTRRFPVETVTWFDCLEFCNRLSERENFTPCYRLTNPNQIDGHIISANVEILAGSGYRLPTEAEWEFACRAGASTAFHFSDSLSLEQANFANPLKRPTNVGSYPPNVWNLHDMHGNVFEWCQDFYSDKYEAQQVESDPQGPTTGNQRIVRGGSWIHEAGRSRSAQREGNSADARRVWDVGFRVARTSPVQNLLPEPKGPIVKMENDPQTVTASAQWPIDGLNRLEREGLVAYRRFCEETLTRYEPTASSTVVLKNLAYLCALAPDAVTDLKRPVVLAERAVAAERTHNSLGTLGAALYRAGRFEEAVKMLQEAMAADVNTPHPGDELFLAMSYWRLEDATAARRSRDKAKRTIQQNAKNTNLSETPRLLAEVEALLTGLELLADVDFRKSDYGFTQGSADYMSAKYANGEWQLLGKIPNTTYFIGPQPVLDRTTVRDFIFEAEVRLANFAKGGWLLRFSQREGFDSADLSMNHEGRVGLNGFGEQLIPMTRAAAMRPVAEFNTVRIEAIQGKVRILVNGVVVDERAENRFTEGTMSIGIHEEAIPVDVRFRAIRLWRPLPATTKRGEKSKTGLAGKKAPNPPDPGNSKFTQMKFKLVSAGTFDMGAPDNEQFSQPDEKPQHRVRITTPFYLSLYEVTQSEYLKVMGRNPSQFANGGKHSKLVKGINTAGFPVDSVSWFDAIEFLNSLSDRDKLPPYYRIAEIQRSLDLSITAATVTIIGGTGYRLPTEAEWEYACRAGATTPYHFGNMSDGSQSNGNGKSPGGTNTPGTFHGRPTKIGSYSKNAFGLFDMHGNVEEWCQDNYDPMAYTNCAGTVEDPLVTNKNPVRVVRGGGWSSNAGDSRSADRYWLSPGTADENHGIRVAKNP